MKFDIPEDKVNLILSILQQAPVPHIQVDPLLKFLVNQANDKRVQALAYPLLTPEEPIHG
jgi:hypothetical protein